MVHGFSTFTLTTSGSSGFFGSGLLWRRHFNFTGKAAISISPGVERDCILKWVFSGHSGILTQRCVRAQAGWIFKGGDQGQDASSERSESANEDVLVFFFKLDLATRVQCALNLEQYDIAKQLRNKLAEVEIEVIRQQETKRGLTTKTEAQDKGICILRLRADLQNAIESENYALAAELRDKIVKLEADSLAVSANALAFENAHYTFRLGQKVRHKMFGYLGVICGMDPVCCESSSWKETAHVEKLLRKSNQPFYQVLVDVHSEPNLLVTYVPEENLLALDQEDRGRLDHPYLSFLFYGTDTAGDFIPVKQLREKYNRPRHEAPSNSQDESGEDS